jgi:transcription antitermination protein NusB
VNARRASRELALLSLLQLARLSSPKTASHDTFSADALLQLADPKLVKDSLVASVRALVSEAQDRVTQAAEDLADVSRYFITLEEEHPDNLATAFDAEAKPVPIPTTRAMVEKIEQLLLACEYLAEAFRIPELATHSKVASVQDYAAQLVQVVQKHVKQLDFIINYYSEDWRLDRLVKLDAMILRLAVAEMLYCPKVDVSVSINEAVELAKLFSTQESHRFINGILGKVALSIESNTLPKPDPTAVAVADTSLALAPALEIPDPLLATEDEADSALAEAVGATTPTWG